VTIYQQGSRSSRSSSLKSGGGLEQPSSSLFVTIEFLLENQEVTSVFGKFAAVSSLKVK
jgi:hypothetical protein